MTESSTLAAFAAVGGLSVALVVHVIRYAYGQGRIDQRLAALETAQADLSRTHGLMGALTATVAGLKDSVDGLHEAVSEIRRQMFRRDSL